MSETGLAEERTALAWRRTALAHLVAGLVLVRLVDDPVPAVALGLLLVASAALAARTGSARDHRRRTPIAVVSLLTFAAALLGAAEMLRSSAP